MSLNPETLKALEFQIKSFVQSYMQASSFDDKVPMMNSDSETARMKVKSWQRQIVLEREQLSAIHKLWPDGFQFINKLNEFIISQEKFYNNLTEWREFTRKTRVTTSNHKAMEENRKFVLKNRELGQQADDQLKVANEILKKETGLDFDDYNPGSADFTKIDTSPE